MKRALNLLAIVGTLLLFDPAAALAQGSVHIADPYAPVVYTGALVKWSESSVTLKERDGRMITVDMTPGWTLVSARALGVDAIKPGDFIASMNMDVDAGTGRSTEVRIMEAGYRPEHGTHPIGRPNASMTHGTVSRVSPEASGVEIDVTYPGGNRHLIVARNVKVTGYDLHDRALLRPGVEVIAATRKGADGTRIAGRLVLAK